MNNTETLSPEQAARLHKDAIVIDGLSFYYDGPTPRLNPELITATNVTVAETYNDFGAAVEEILTVRAALARDPGARLVERAADIEQAKQDGVVGIIFGLQASLPIGTDLSRIGKLYDLGVRIIQLTYNDRTWTGDGCLEPVDGGLSRFGREFIEELARVGVALDLSHVGRRTSLEAIAASPKPPMFSHANPATLTDNPRNLTDEQIKAIGERGGLIGCCTWAPLCYKNRAGVQPTVDDFLDHVDYVVDLIGIDHVGIATDSECTANTAWVAQHSLEFNTAFPEIASGYYAHFSDRTGITQPVGVEGGIADLSPITQGLARRGYREEDMRKVIGGNFLRHLREVWGS